MPAPANHRSCGPRALWLAARALVAAACLFIWSVDAEARGRGRGGRSHGSVRAARAARPASPAPARATPRARPEQRVAQPYVRSEVRGATAPANRYEYRRDVRGAYPARPVYGTRVRTLPSYARRAHFRGRSYYYWGAAYYLYDEAADEYVSVETPIGALVEELPGGCDPVMVGDQEYFRCDDGYYRQGYYQDDVWYQRVEPP